MSETSAETRTEASRVVPAEPAAIFAVLCDPQGHVAIDATGMLQDATGSPVSAAGDTFVVHMDREALGDRPEMGRYDVEVTIRSFVPDREISWTIVGTVRPGIGHVFGYELEPLPEADGGGTRVTSYCDWSEAREDWKHVFPIVTTTALRGTLGILDRTVRRGYPRGTGRA
ncbi:polyketide cyclase [Nocardioides sp. CFH 31398]|uniref:polyketide cyclase n=1 Tax=Nocardioides sp. CFH 31398 TaxID=2919579 RepID=UPI001F06862A|nr:polyketide cyclase [Nocardioides sp. CFH 31398]MCH1864963.1 polyketide cyclase [Nocardioides sp. CFH 31398]